VDYRIVQEALTEALAAFYLGVFQKVMHLTWFRILVKVVQIFIFIGLLMQIHFGLLFILKTALRQTWILFLHFHILFNFKLMPTEKELGR